VCVYIRASNAAGDGLQGRTDVPVADVAQLRAWDDGRCVVDALYARGEDGRCLTLCEALLARYVRNKAAVNVLLDTAVRCALRARDADALERLWAHPVRRVPPPSMSRCAARWPGSRVRVVQAAAGHPHAAGWRARRAEQCGDVVALARAVQTSLDPLQARATAWLQLAEGAWALARQTPERAAAGPFWTAATVLATTKAVADATVPLRTGGGVAPSSFARPQYERQLAAAGALQGAVHAWLASHIAVQPRDAATTAVAALRILRVPAPADAAVARTQAGDALVLLASLCPPAWLAPDGGSGTVGAGAEDDMDALARWFSEVAVRLAELQQRDPALLDADCAPAPPPPPPEDDDDNDDDDKGDDEEKGGGGADGVGAQG
jgi:hypothetical protein